MPDAGEGLTEAEIVTWRVRVGDTVSVNQTIVEVETAKSLVELPSPFAGRVVELLAAEGESVDVGTPIITVDVAPDEPTQPSPPDPGTVPRADIPHAEIPPAGGAVEPGLIGGVAPGGRTSVLVGYGPRTTSAARRQRIRREPAPERPLAPVRVLAKPPVRRLARDLGVDLAAVRAVRRGRGGHPGRRHRRRPTRRH